MAYVCPICGKDTDGMTVTGLEGEAFGRPICLACGTAIAVGIAKSRPGYDPKQPIRVHLNMVAG
jgi:hypothetical protein